MALPLLAIGIGAAVGGIGNLLSSSSAANQRNAALGQAIGTLRSRLLSQNDINSGLRNINREYNSATTNVLNSTAIRSRGLANAPTVAAAAGARLQPSRINALEGFREGTRSFNAGIFDRIAGLQSQTAVHDPVGSFFGGAIQGGIAGAQVGNLLSAGAGAGEVAQAGLGATSQIASGLTASQQGNALPLASEPELLPDVDYGQNNVSIQQRTPDAVAGPPQVENITQIQSASPVQNFIDKLKSTAEQGRKRRPYVPFDLSLEGF